LWSLYALQALLNVLPPDDPPQPRLFLPRLAFPPLRLTKPHQGACERYRSPLTTSIACDEATQSLLSLLHTFSSSLTAKGASELCASDITKRSSMRQHHRECEPRSTAATLIFSCCRVFVDLFRRVRSEKRSSFDDNRRFEAPLLAFRTCTVLSSTIKLLPSHSALYKVERRLDLFLSTSLRLLSLLLSPSFSSLPTLTKVRFDTLSTCLIASAALLTLSRSPTPLIAPHSSFSPLLIAPSDRNGQEQQ
jgi:hypothetical protein